MLLITYLLVYQNIESLETSSEPNIINVSWNSFIKRWISGVLNYATRTGQLSEIKNILILTKRIHSLCFDMASSYYISSKQRNMLCGSIKINNISKANYKDWILKIPDNLCTSITIVEVPTSDQLLQEHFELTITYLQPDLISVPDQIVLSQSYEPFSLTTDTSMTKLHLRVSQVSKQSKLLLYFQATGCNLPVSRNMAVLYQKQPLRLPNDFPFSYYPLEDITEYHVLVRTDIGSRVQISAKCEILNSLQLFDGPSLWVSPIYKYCDENSDNLEIIKATTFQMYIVYMQKHRNSAVKLVYSEIALNSVYYKLLPKYGQLWISWSLGNSSMTIYQDIFVDIRGVDNEIMSYRILDSQTRGPQGYLCQYAGVVIRHSHKKLPSDVGPVCSSDYGDLLHDIKIHSRDLSVIIYGYKTSSFFQTGKLVIYHEMSSCIGIINPCSICDSLAYYYEIYTIRVLQTIFICYKHESDVSIQQYKQCIIYQIIPNEQNHKMCNLFIYSAHLITTFEFHIKHRYIQSRLESQNKKMYLPEKHYSLVNKEKSINEGYQMYQSICANLSTELFPHKSILIIALQDVSCATCNATNVLPPTCNKIQINSMKHIDNVSEFEGTCFKFIVTLSKNGTQSKIKIYFSRNIESLKNYLNNFQIISWIDSNKNKDIHFLHSLTLSIIDQMQMEDKPLQFKFTGDQLPLIWKSFGQFLQINIDAKQNLEENVNMTVIAVAMYHPVFVRSFFKNTHKAQLPCHPNATHATSTNCMSVHDKFEGSWISASQICEDKGGYLWSIEYDDEWIEVLTSRRYPNLLASPVRPVNAMKYFRLSSLVFLGLKVEKSKVRNIFN